MEYNFRETEKKWQQYWAEKKTFRADNNSQKPKYYVLDMFPYPSGAGLHVGHPLGYIASDIYTRYKRLKGFNVLHPMGYDAFGLPAEQYAIQTGQHPAITTEQNIKRYREQLDNIGFSFDWEREIRTSDPKYYKWTQWIFLKLFNAWYNPETDKAEPLETLVRKLEAGNWKLETGDWNSLSEKQQSEALMDFRLAFLSEAFVNWCPALGTVLANDEVKDGVSERGGYPVERKKMKQWSMRITSYAQRLLDDLETIDWSESIKEQQRNWIGRSEGASVKFRLIPNPSPKEKGTPDSASEKKFGYETSNKSVWPFLKNFSKENRKNQTEAEKIVWENVRDGRLGFKIRRQHPIGEFIADFICLEKKLVIEVDGYIHETQKEYDEARTFYLNQYGFRVIRFTNQEVSDKIGDVVEKIKNELLKSEEDSPSPLEKWSGDEAIEVFTTRPDTIFGATFMTLAPEHDLVQQITTSDQKEAVTKYVEEAKNRSDRERMTEVKRISGVFTGAYAENPLTKKPIPIWIGDYVLAGYGTGAVMAVPAHDERDHAFAKHFGLEIKQVIETPADWDIQEKSFDSKDSRSINSDFINGLQTKEAIKKIVEEVEKRKIGEGKINFRLRDAVFGRQRYWGEPIPIYYENGIPKAVDEKSILSEKIKLPEIEKYLPTETGEPPLARAEKWFWNPASCQLVTANSPGSYALETTTMPGWAGSSWYFLRYMDANNDKEFVSKEAINYWKDVDLYIGGSEHATGHLLYVRFWTKFLFDLGLIPVQEPAKKLINQGMIQGRSNFVYGLSPLFVWESSTEKKNDPIFPLIYIGKSIYEKFQIHSLDDSFKNKIRDFGMDIFKKLNPDFKCLDFGLHVYSSHVNVNIVNDDILNKEAFKNSNKEFTDAYFFPDEEKYVCGWEVEKMSKSKYNVVSPDDIVNQHGADALRLYEMFLGPLELSKPWNTNGITGVSSFIRKLWRLYHSKNQELRTKNQDNISVNQQLDSFYVNDELPTKQELKSLHKLIKKVTEDIERFSFNTSVSSFMICVNELTDLKCNKRAILEPLVILVSPYAPHVAEELWEKLGHKESVTFATWMEHNEEYLTESSFAYPISVNGKTRFNLEIALSLSKDEIEKEVMSSEEVKKVLQGQPPKKVIIVPGRIVNIVV